MPSEREREYEAIKASYPINGECHGGLYAS